MIEIYRQSLYTIKRTIKFKRYADYNFTSDSCLLDYGQGHQSASRASKEHRLAW